MRLFTCVISALLVSASSMVVQGARPLITAESQLAYLDATDARLNLDLNNPEVSAIASGKYVNFHMADAGGPVGADGEETGADRMIKAGHMHGFKTGRADSHAPIGVMGEHVHAAGDIMLSYRYMYMKMDGNRSGDSSLSDGEVRADGFGVVPTDMTMEMHMFGAMWAPTDDVTLMLMVPYLRLEMDHLAGAPLGSVAFTTKTEGIGDIKLSSLIKLYRGDHNQFHVNVGLSLPTANINERASTTPPGAGGILPYPMQLGSGTVDLLLGGTYVYQFEKWSLGTQVNGVIRLHENYRNYTLGDRFEWTGWFQWNWFEQLATSVRFDYQIWGNIDGADPGLPVAPFPVPTADPERRGGQRLDLLLGVNWQFKDGFLKGHRIAIEGGLPIWQKLEGPQLEVDWLLTVGWQFAF